MARKQVSKKVRFEVFKRDSFKCQYCGQSSPDVVLHVDHIQPVSKGGDNEIINLITSCEGCNLGKSNIELDDSTAISKQRQQLEDLNKRREQLEMMLSWREGVKGIDQQQVDAFCEEFENSTGSSITETGERKVKSWIRKYGLIEVMDCLELSVERYLNHEDGADKVYRMIPRIASNRSKPESHQNALYVRGILRNRLTYVNEHDALKITREAIEAGYSFEEMKELAKEVRNWTDYQTTVENMLED